MAGRGDDVVLCDGWAPVDEVRRYGGVWAELDVVIAFVYEGPVEVLIFSRYPRLFGLPVPW